MNKEECNHIICLLDDTDCLEGYYPIYLNENYKFKNYEKYINFNYCPLCGKNFQDLIIEVINNLNKNK